MKEKSLLTLRCAIMFRSLFLSPAGQTICPGMEELPLNV